MDQDAIFTEILRLVGKLKIFVSVDDSNASLCRFLLLKSIVSEFNAECNHAREHQVL